MSFDFTQACEPEAKGPKGFLVRGLLLCGLLACCLPWTPPWAALLGGTAIALSVGNPCAALTGRLSKWLLQASVVGLGAGIHLGIVAKVGLQGLGYTFGGLLFTFLLGYLLAKWLGVGAKMSALICAGTGICGGSAIAALAPSIEARGEETSASLATVFLLNGAALILFPWLGTLAGLSTHEFGLWCAIAIHDTSSVTGAALTRGQEALQLATTVKLARALWIIPVVLALAYLFNRKTPGKKGGKLSIPWFIGGFIGLSALFTFVPGLAPAAPFIKATAKVGLTVTLFFIGAGLSRAAIKSVGAKPFLLGVMLWILVSSASLGALKLGWIH